MTSSSVIELSTRASRCSLLLIIVGGAIEAPLIITFGCRLCHSEIKAYLDNDLAPDASPWEYRTSITCSNEKGFDVELSVSTLTIFPTFIGAVLA